MAKKRRMAAKRKKKPAKRRKSTPVTVARAAISKVAKPGSKFSATTLKQKLKRKYKKTSGETIDQLVGFAKRKRLITPVTKTKMVFTPAAAPKR